jgi:hypothetical protein
MGPPRESNRPRGANAQAAELKKGFASARRTQDLAKLPDLAQAIEAAHLAAHRAALPHVIRCGQLLIEAKSAVSHGGWAQWVEANLSFGDRQARKYMAIAREAEVFANRNCGSDLGINAALELLAARNGSQALRVMGSSASDEWYTPPHIVTLAVATLGQLDLDPCWHPASPVRPDDVHGRG